MALVLRTERTVVSELELSDLPEVIELLTDPVAMRFWPRPYTAEEASDWIGRHRERYERDGCGYWMARLRNGSAIGQVGVLRQEIEGRHEWGLGYILLPRFYGQGLATEAATACVAWAQQTLGADRVIALIRPENEPSVAVARRLGMTFEREVDYAGFRHGLWAMSLESASEDRS